MPCVERSQAQAAALHQVARESARRARERRHLLRHRRLGPASFSETSHNTCHNKAFFLFSPSFFFFFVRGPLAKGSSSKAKGIKRASPTRALCAASLSSNSRTWKVVSRRVLARRVRRVCDACVSDERVCANLFFFFAALGIDRGGRLGGATWTPCRTRIR